MDRQLLKTMVQTKIYSMTENRDDSLVEFTVDSIDEQVKNAITDHVRKTGEILSPRVRLEMYKFAIDSIKVNDAD